MEVTTLTPRPSARCSTSAPLTAPEVWPSTASSAPTELSSTRTTSSATGGSTLTAPPPLTSTVSMMSTLLRLLDAALDVRDPQAAQAGEEDSKQVLQRQVTASNNISRLCISSQCNVPHSAIIC